MPFHDVTWYQACSASFSAFAGLFQYGYAIGSVNSATTNVQNAYAEHYMIRDNVTLSPASINAIWVMTSASFPIGGIFGSLLVSQILKRFGRRNGMAVGHAVTVFAAILIGISDILVVPEFILIGRFLIGIVTAGAGTGITTIYIAEISSRSRRGFFGTLVSLNIAIGLFSSNAIGISETLNSNELWSVYLALIAVPSFLYLLFFKFLPESPRTLYLERNQKEKAVKVLRKLRGTDDVDNEITELKQEQNKSREIQHMTVLELIKSKSHRRPLVISVTLCGVQQLTGINGVSFNMNNIYKAAGIPQNQVQYVSAGVSFLMILASFISTALVDKKGRKFLLILGYAMQFVCHIVLTFSLEMQHLSIVMPYVSIVASSVFLVAFALGPGPVTLLTAAEFFDQSSRSAGMTLSVVSLWFWFAVMVVATPYLLASINGYTFLIFGSFAMFSIIFLHCSVPESKGKTFSQIQNSFRQTPRQGTSKEPSGIAMNIYHGGDDVPLAVDA